MEPTDQSKTAAYYAQHAQEYFERTDDLDLGAVYEPFERRLRAGSRILDLGCGSGRDARHFAAQGHAVVALDPCRELLTLADRHTPGDIRDRILFVVGAAPDLGFGDGQFDAVWACGSLLHLLRHMMLPALRECRRVLHYGGVLYVGVKQGDGDSDDDRRLCVLWEIHEVRRLATDAGFSVLSATEQPSLDGRELSWIGLLAEAR